MNRKFLRLCIAPVAVSLLLTLACSKDDTPDVGAESPAQLSADATVTENHGDNTISWMIGSEGQVQAVVKGSTDQPLADAKGMVSVKPFGSSDKPTFHELEAKPGVLSAQIGKLEAELTEVEYQ